MNNVICLRYDIKEPDGLLENLMELDLNSLKIIKLDNIIILLSFDKQTVRKEKLNKLNEI